MNFKKAGRSLLERLGLVEPRQTPVRLPEPSLEELEPADQQATSPRLIALHGIHKRSGTVYLGETIRLHPGVEAFPGRLWETPILKNIHHLERFEQDFIKDFPQNENKLPRHYFARLLGQAFVQDIQKQPDQTVLLKCPSVHHLAYFPLVFPGQKLIILVRDGRNNVASLVKTWPNYGFERACHEWNSAAREIIRFQSLYREQSFHQTVRYEDLLESPRKVVETLLAFLDLPVADYPFDKLESLPVRGSSDTAQGREQAHWEAVPKSKDFSPQDRWKDWSPDMKSTFQRIAGESMAHFGYES